jgi:hypothetical protein
MAQETTMIKKIEKSKPSSCWNKAFDDEMIFVLRAKDKCAPAAIRSWVTARIALGLNHSADPKIIEALSCADHMEKQQEEMANRIY